MEKYWICSDCGAMNLYPDDRRCEVCDKPIDPKEAQAAENERGPLLAHGTETTETNVSDPKRDAGRSPEEKTEAWRNGLIPEGPEPLPGEKTENEASPYRWAPSRVERTEDTPLMPKKRAVRPAVWIFAAVAVATIAFSVVLGPSAFHYLTGNSALKDGDYDRAISAFENVKSGPFKGTEKIAEAYYRKGEDLLDRKHYSDALACFEKASAWRGTAEAIRECALGLLSVGLYDDAAEAFLSLPGDKDKLYAKYAEGMKYFDRSDYRSARRCFVDANSVGESDKMLCVCDLQEAEKLAGEGKLHQALKIYQDLPQSLSYEGISVASRLSLLMEHSDMVNASGYWEATQNDIDVKNVQSDGKYRQWYASNLWSNQCIYVYFKLNADGTFRMTGEVFFWRYTNCAEKEADLSSDRIKYTFDRNGIAQIPSVISLDPDTNLRYSNGRFSIDFFRKEPSYYGSSLEFNSKVTYGALKEAY